MFDRALGEHGLLVASDILLPKLSAEMRAFNVACFFN